MTDRPAGTPRPSLSTTPRPSLHALMIALVAVAASGCGDFPGLVPYVDLGPRPTAPDAGDMNPGADATPTDADRPDAELDVEVDRAVPRPETCDGQDNDLDGTVDEGIEVTPCQAGDGRCAFEGELRCVDGTPTCVGEAEAPIDETCNGIDDDCDGEVDNGFDDLGAACSAGIGVCRDEGVFECNAAGDGTVCGAVERRGVRAAEVCDGADNDCDGAVDEIEGQPDMPLVAGCYTDNGDGQCAIGTWTCEATAQSGEAWSACEPLGPVNELCNGLDDDCDGNNDEEIRNIGLIGQPCQIEGIEPPLPGCPEARYQCSADGDGVECVAPPERTCDGFDENCDGVIDDGRGCGEAISSACRAWLGWTVEDIGDMVEMWGACPTRADWSDGLSCNGAPAGGRPFAEISIGGDVDPDLDRLGVSWRCQQGDGRPLTAFAQRACRIYLGLGPADTAPADGSPTWGPCPDASVGAIDGVSCTTGDGMFRPMPPPVDVDEDAVLSVAFRCSPIDFDGLLPDGLLPAPTAERLQKSVEILVAWADADVEAGEIDWEAVCAPGGDGNSATACVSSGGDGLFHTLRFITDLDAQDRLAIGLRPLDVR